MPWWAWPPVLALAALTGAELTLGAPRARLFVIIGAATVGLIALVVSSRLRIWITGDELRVDDTRLPIRHIAAARPLTIAQRRDLLGPAAHPLAFVILRPWVGTAVLIELDDPADPTPYWVISTRHPAALAAALARPTHPA